MGKNDTYCATCTAPLFPDMHVQAPHGTISLRTTATAEQIQQAAEIACGSESLGFGAPRFIKEGSLHDRVLLRLKGVLRINVKWTEEGPDGFRIVSTNIENALTSQRAFAGVIPLGRKHFVARNRVRTYGKAFVFALADVLEEPL